MNRDTGVVVNTSPSNSCSEGMGDGNLYDWIPDTEAWQFQRYDEMGKPRSLNGRLVDAHEVLNSTASASAYAPASGAVGIACKEQKDFYVRYNGGYMIPTHSKIGQGVRIYFEKLLKQSGKNELIPLYLENDTPNVYLNREVKSEETHSVRNAEQYFSERVSQQSVNGYGRAVPL